jgi:hypothetical protein
MSVTSNVYPTLADVKTERELRARLQMRKRADLLMGVVLLSDMPIDDRILDKIIRCAEQADIKPCDAYSWLEGAEFR